MFHMSNHAGIFFIINFNLMNKSKHNFNNYAYYNIWTKDKFMSIKRRSYRKCITSKIGCNGYMRYYWSLGDV